MGAKTGSIFFQKEPDQERSAKAKVCEECPYKAGRRKQKACGQSAYSWHCKKKLQQLRVLPDHHLILLKNQTKKMKKPVITKKSSKRQ